MTELLNTDTRRIQKRCKINLYFFTDDKNAEQRGQRNTKNDKLWPSYDSVGIDIYYFQSALCTIFITSSGCKTSRCPPWRFSCGMSTTSAFSRIASARSAREIGMYPLGRNFETFGVIFLRSTADMPGAPLFTSCLSSVTTKGLYIDNLSNPT